MVTLGHSWLRGSPDEGFQSLLKAPRIDSRPCQGCQGRFLALKENDYSIFNASCIEVMESKEKLHLHHLFLFF